AWPQLAEEIAHAVKAHSAVLDGEICCLQSDGRPNFHAVMFRRAWPWFYAFDVLSINGVDLCGLPLLERKRHLQAIMPKIGCRRCGSGRRRQSRPGALSRWFVRIRSGAGLIVVLLADPASAEKSSIRMMLLPSLPKHREFPLLLRLDEFHLRTADVGLDQVGTGHQPQFLPELMRPSHVSPRSI